LGSLMRGFLEPWLPRRQPDMTEHGWERDDWPEDTGVRSSERLVRCARADPDHQLPTIGDPYRYVAVEQKRQPTEHGFLGYAVLVTEPLADSMGELVVIGHLSVGACVSDLEFEL
jgi:hypothetical protein